jgi:hypothetical protein
MKSNSQMEPLLGVLRSINLVETELPVELQELLSAGWCIGPASSLLLKGLAGPGWRTDWLPDEVSQHEYEVNDVWISPVGIPGPRDVFLGFLLARSMKFALIGLRAARELEASDYLIAVISLDIEEDDSANGATVKFLTRRSGYPSSFDNLERFQFEAVAVLDLIDAGRFDV